MALQSSFYNTDGTTRTYPSTKHIATKQHVAVYGKRVSDSVWEILAVDLYELVNNSVVFDTSPDVAVYSQIEVRVADTAGELGDSPSDIAIVAGIAADISTVATNTSNVNTVSTNIASVQTVSANNANVTTVATNIANVNTVAGNTANVNTVSSISGNVTTVAGISANVTTVATNTANINTVATDISAITTVANDLNEPVSEIETVAGSISNVDTVGTNIANVNTVAGSIANVNTVATNVSNVNSVATTVVPNIAEILLADDNATTATAKALEAQHWANYTTDVAVPEGTGEFSAKHYSVKAGEYASSINPTNIMHLTGDESASGIKTFTSGINAPQLVGFKNHIINGNFIINQRAYVSGTATTTANQYIFDRWRIPTSGQSATFTTTNGITTVTAPASGIEQIIENLSIIGTVYTLSYTGTATPTVSQSIDNITYTPIAPNADGSYSVTSGNYIKVNLASGTAAKVQFEPGSVATPFENRPFGLELSLCQRYYEICRVYGTNRRWAGSAASNYNAGVYQYKSTKRSIPTITLTPAPSYINCSALTVLNNQPDAMSATVTTTAVGFYAVSYDFTASAEL